MLAIIISPHVLSCQIFLLITYKQGNKSHTIRQLKMYKRNTQHLKISDTATMSALEKIHLQNLCKVRHRTEGTEKMNLLPVWPQDTSSSPSPGSFTFSLCSFLSSPAHLRRYEQLSPVQGTERSFSSVETKM